jgi:hypothetical protein
MTTITTTTIAITCCTSPKCQCSADNLLSLERQPPFFPPSSTSVWVSSHQETHTRQRDNPFQYTNRTAGHSLRVPTMGQQEEVAAVQKPPAAAVVFTWEPVVTVTAKRPEGGVGDTTAVITPAGSPTTKAARRLAVPPPPGRAAARSLSSRAGGRAVRPEDDPFLAAYLACTKSGSRGGGGGGDAGGTGTGAPRQRQGWSRFAWARLGLSCKSSAGAVERSMVKLAKRPEAVDPRDA